jgi:hypothetical protein
MREKLWYTALLGVIASGAISVAVTTAPVSGAVCGSVGGRHVDVNDCAGPADAPPPAGGESAPPPPPPDVNVCADVGRRVTVGGCA